MQTKCKRPGYSRLGADFSPCACYYDFALGHGHGHGSHGGHGGQEEIIKIVRQNTGHGSHGSHGGQYLLYALDLINVHCC